MPSFSRLLLSLSTAAALAMPAIAQAQHLSPMQFGGSFGSSTPRNGLQQTFHTGITGALFAEQALGDGFSVQAELRGFQHEGQISAEQLGASSSGLLSVDYSLGVAAASGNLLYERRFPRHHRIRPYVTVGAGVYRIIGRTSALYPIGERLSNTDRQNEVGSNVGGGVRLNDRLALDVRYHRVASNVGTIGLIPISLSARF